MEFCYYKKLYESQNGCAKEKPDDGFVLLAGSARHYILSGWLHIQNKTGGFG